MRLINTSSLAFEVYHDNSHLPAYAILSHCWGAVEDEISYQAFLNGTYNECSTGWLKISTCCRIARERGLKFAWVDTCCIDKTSSAELTEAINSMFIWYKLSKECYVFLSDVDGDTLQGKDLSCSFDPCGAGINPNDVQAFLHSRWHTRGWTLQELLAPSSVEIFNTRFESIGTRLSLAALIAQATGIETAFLTQSKSIYDASIAKRMYWASNRMTQRIEDIAYCLLGVFDVNLPLLYGEGDKAFFRLQSAIMEQSADESIFSWGYEVPQEFCSGILATSPKDFSNSRDIVVAQKFPGAQNALFELTNQGLRYPLWGRHFMIPGQIRNGDIIPLACRHTERNNRILLWVVDVDGKWYRAGLHDESKSNNAIGRIARVILYLILRESYIYVVPRTESQYAVWGLYGDFRSWASGFAQSWRSADAVPIWRVFLALACLIPGFFLANYWPSRALVLTLGIFHLSMELTDPGWRLLHICCMIVVGIPPFAVS